MAPPAVADSAPPLVKVKAGKAIAAALKLSVKLRRLVKEARFVGSAAEALLFVKLTSRIFPSVPPKVIALLILFA